jgi:hypothetical protein
MDRNVRRTIFKYVLMSDELYRRTDNDVVLKCLGPGDAILAMTKVHEGICGTHQSAPKMKWLLQRSGFYWPNMIADCFKYYKGCQVCQKFGDLQLVTTAELHPIIKPWPFRGWGLDFIGEIHPSSSKWHRFVLVATDYFTKWTEAVALKNMTVTPRDPQTPRHATRLHYQQSNTKQNKIWQHLLCNYKHRRSKRDISIQNESY